ncbi:DUF4268 domain-containing protein [Levilinea saccharolytica]|uniref:DUF4268 domain-containing protein n=1 Tax=Levilinea saccharolytica TaxID=229921 RepID=UPI0007847F5B|nr:DUF4268 domain-containing protein [Levilinea saccharolytica]GAP18878.1 hypothetical protein LSAC_02776 [Levilinea saccharolytica]
MASWVEDIIQALKNLGGQATLAQIYEEVKKIRTEPLPDTYKASIRERIEAHSSDSSNFKGTDYFRKVEKGVWALRDHAEVGSIDVGVGHRSQVFNRSTSIQGEDESMSTWIEDIIQAFKNLGGEASLQDIMEEVKSIRGEPLPKRWREIIHDNIYYHSSDTKKFRGKKDLFRKVSSGIWTLRGQVSTSQFGSATKKLLELMPEKYLPPESLEDIENILRTIKQYRDYKHPDSPSWKEYVDEFFHILGFSTDGKSQRLMTLGLMGANHTPKAIVCYVKPGENFEEITPGLEWESYLFYAAQFHQIDWGILTDGLRLKIIHFKDQENKQTSYWPDLDGIVCQEKLDTFCTVYKVFLFIKGYDGKSTVQGHQKKLQQGQKDGELAERHVLRLKFWGELLEKAKTKTKLHAKVSPGIGNWISAGAGKSGLGFNYVVRMDDAQVELYIDRGDVEWNKMVFNTFLQHKSEIERIFGEPLDWQLLPDKRASRVRFVISGYGLKDEDQWDELQEQLINAMIRLEMALKSFINIIG